jgi:hypothetical protein
MKDEYWLPRRDNLENIVLLPDWDDTGVYGDWNPNSYKNWCNFTNPFRGEIDSRLLQAKTRFPEYADADALVADAFIRGL